MHMNISLSLYIYIYIYIHIQMLGLCIYGVACTAMTSVAVSAVLRR